MQDRYLFRGKRLDKSYDTMMMYEVKDLIDDLLDIVKAGGTDA